MPSGRPTAAVSVRPYIFRRPTSRWAKSCSRAAFRLVPHSYSAKARDLSCPAIVKHVANRSELNQFSTQSLGCFG